MRGTTCYLVDQRVNMLPERLGEDVSSLHPRVDRLAFSILWEMDEQANILSTRVAKTLIRSRAGLTYREAQARIDTARAAALSCVWNPCALSVRGLPAAGPGGAARAEAVWRWRGGDGAYKCSRAASGCVGLPYGSVREACGCARTRKGSLLVRKRGVAPGDSGFPCVRIRVWKE